MDATWFDSAALSLTPEKVQALLPYLWLCGGIALSAIGVGVRLPNALMRVLHACVLLPFAAWLVWTFRDPSVDLFGTSLHLDTFTRAVGAAVAVLAALSGFASGGSAHKRTEWSPLMLIGTLGMSLLPGARDWIAFFVYLETLAIAGYVLAALDVERESSLEAGMKYLMMGAFASSLLLMGMTLLYGSAGSFDYDRVRATLSAAPHGGLAGVGVFLIIASLGFKVALFPFHMWAPDVYQASPAGVAGFLASATKVAVFGAAAVSFERSGLWLQAGAREFVQILAIASIVFGNALAVAQRRLRRLLAYSSVANAGYAALALASGAQASGSLVVSLVIYGTSVIAIFSMVHALTSTFDQANRYDLDLVELPKAVSQAPLLVSLVLALCLFSLAGIPPFPGFLGKYVVLSDVWASGFRLGAAALALGTLLGLAYYLKVLVPIYLEKGHGGVNRGQTVARSESGAMIAGTVASLVLIAVLLGFSRFHQWVELVEGFAR